MRGPRSSGYMDISSGHWPAPRCRGGPGRPRWNSCERCSGDCRCRPRRCAASPKSSSLPASVSIRSAPANATTPGDALARSATRWTAKGKRPMPQHRERRWPSIVAGYAVLGMIGAALTAFLYDSASPASQPLVIRLAVACAAAAVILHLRAYFRGDPRWEPPSSFEEALVRQPPAAKLDPGFTKLRDEVASGAADRSYFANVLWPRLCALYEARGGRGELSMP